MPEIEVPMPKLSMTMEEGELISWVKHEGDQVRAGDVIAEVNSDKVEMEVESPADGTLVRLAAAEGEVVPVGAPIATLETEAEDLLGGILGAPPGDQPAEEAAARPDGGETAAPPPAGEAPATEKAPAPSGEAPAGPVPVVPAARRRAAELGVDLAAVTGSGPDGLVRVADVEAAAAPEEPAAREEPAAPAEAGDVEEVPLTPMRRVVARRLTESMQSAPHFYLTVRVDVTRLLGLRAELNRQLAASGQDVKVSVNDLIVKACAGLLAGNRELNVSFGGDKLVVHRRVHIGVAVAVDGGLLVPVVRDADHKRITELAREAGELAGRARAGKLGGDDMGGGTFTVSNLGMLGIEQFTAVINPPEAAILAVGAAGPEPLVTADGQIEVRQVLRMTLSIDHRAVDGATGARFLSQLKDVLEQPLRIVA
ncbi:MAG TPA: dihydrolipoamide acetyltransferase family protein [Actinomycetota bacterium]|jgi:pyruvate dehydrogenase E2 component (dihydrolipoamide acetyltransferase)|nr:dihydrolipoamide acetyltransferase family protein [Actinomycetota bacterium]